MTGPLVSIGISTYNRAASYLPQALESALAQGYENLEIIVSDNASSDETERYVRGVDDPRLRYFRQTENIGANGNFNFCLQQARGAYFLLLHDDDLIDPDFVESCVAAAENRTDYGVIRTGTRTIDANGRVLSRTPNASQGLSGAELFLHWFDRKTAFYCCSTLFNTEALRGIGGFHTPANVFEDVVAIAKLVARHEHANVMPCKASFRRHDSNKGGSLNGVNDWTEDALYLLQVLREEMPADAERLEQAGKPYLCAKLYRYVAKLPDWRERLRTYVWLYRLFGYSYSPLHFLARQRFLQLKATARHLIKRDDFRSRTA